VVATPLALLYRGAVGARNAAFDRGLLRVERPPVPVLSVGNLAVGGTGKTPFAAWLARTLADHGLDPALVARGYGEDELRLHRRWNPDVPVHAHRDRPAATRRAAEGGARCVVLDDGFQHRRLARDLDVVLLAAEQPFPDRLLPRGRWREPASALTRADAVVVTRKSATEAEAETRAAHAADAAPAALLVRVDLEPGPWTDLDGEAVDEPGGDVLAVTGVAGPDSFAGVVAKVTGEPPELMAFPDHHDYDAGDAERITRAAGPRPVVTTEKDAVKLTGLRKLLPDVHVLPLVVRPGRGAEELIERARAAVEAGPRWEEQP
jgi:tetraacyldisaccharide 4'-kinase